MPTIAVLSILCACAPMFPHCAGLTKVNLSCYELTDGGIGELARHCAGLTKVDLRWCKELTDGGIGDFKRQLPNCDVKKYKAGALYL